MTKTNTDRIERFHQYLLDNDVQFSQYSWDTFASGKANCMATLSILFKEWRKEDDKIQAELSQRAITQQAIAQKGADSVMAELDRELARERKTLKNCKTSFEREFTLNAIASILSRRKLIKESPEYKDTHPKQAVVSGIDMEDWSTTRKWLTQAAIMAVAIIVFALVALIIYFVCDSNFDTLSKVLICWLLYGCVFNIAKYAVDHPSSGIVQEIASGICIIFLGAIVVAAVLTILGILLAIWYCVCGGFFLFSDGLLYEPDVWDYIFITPLSIGLLIYIVGGGAMLFKK